uniref:Epsilon-coat protein n=1 Tax=Parastrongyloides trichosuri TaxID=131310 RepID=A0A0N4Z2C4_PARTI
MTKNITTLPDHIKDAGYGLINKTITRPVVTQDINGINELIKMKHLRAAANLCQKLLTDTIEEIGKNTNNPNLIFKALEIYGIRFQILMGLKLYDVLLEEINNLPSLDIPEFSAIFYPELKSNNLDYCSLVPFSLRLCYAECLKYSSNPWDCIPRIEQLHKNVIQVIDMVKNNNENENYIEDWQKRLTAVELMKARSLYFLKQSRLSFKLYTEILSDIKDENLKKQILQMLVRLSIVTGDEKTMEKYIKKLNPQTGATQYYLHKCLRAIFNGNYPYAQEQLQNISRTNDSDSIVVNNLAVSLLYNGKPSESIEIIKKYKEIPPEIMFTNMHTLVELTSPNCEEIKNGLFSKWFEKLADGYNAQEMKLFQSK